nr:rad52 recombinase [uncultured Mediterranean phage uvMED]
MELPNLAGVISEQDVESKGSGSYKADYISWARTMQLLHQHAPGWLPDAIPAEGGCLLHNAAVGCYLLIRFVHTDGTVTPAVPQAVMDNRNNAIPFDKITARDITDTHRRGLAMAAALQFGLASELWAGNMGENPYRPEPAKAPSGNGKTIPTTQQEPSSNGSAPTVDSLKKLIASIPADDATALKQAFMADHHPSFDGDMNLSHLGKAEHRIALKQLIDEYKTPVAA